LETVIYTSAMSEILAESLLVWLAFPRNYTEMGRAVASLRDSLAQLADAQDGAQLSRPWAQHRPPDENNAAWSPYSAPGARAVCAAVATHRGDKARSAMARRESAHGVGYSLQGAQMRPYPRRSVTPDGVLGLRARFCPMRTSHFRPISDRRDKSYFFCTRGNPQSLSRTGDHRASQH